MNPCFQHTFEKRLTIPRTKLGAFDYKGYETIVEIRFGAV